MTSIPSVGIKDTFYRNTAFSPGEAGENQIWDFSTQDFSDMLPNEYEECNNINNCVDFPGTNLVENAVGSYIYYTVSPTVLSNIGYAGSGAFPFYFNDPEDFYRFPFTYGNSFVDNWDGYYNNGGVDYYRVGVDSVFADGWGTLITPEDTFTNVLRIKRKSAYRDSSNVNGVPMLIDYKVTLYIWNDLMHKDFLYNTREVIQTVQGESPSTKYFSTYVVGEKATVPNGIRNISSSNKLNFQIYPNPANDKVNIGIDLLSNANVNICVTDVIGRIVYSSLPNNQLLAGENTITLSTANFLPGIYLVKIMVNGNIAFGKIVVE